MGDRTPDTKLNEKRRVFLMQASAAAVVGVVAPACGDGGMMTGDGGTAETGTTGSFHDSGLTVAAVAVDAVVAPTSGAYFVGRDANGIYAFTNVCTHQACNVELRSGGTIECPCHSSSYSKTGDVVVGAVSGQRNLNHLAVMLMGTGDTAQILVNPSSVVSDRATRVAVG